MKKIKVLVVDDSALMRQVLSAILSEAPDIEVVGTAMDPYVAREKIKALKPDVLTLDIEMPKMDGLTFLGHLMRLRPMPVIMISTLTEKGADITLQALSMGAVDFIPKPKVNAKEAFEEYSEEVVEKVRHAFSVPVHRLEAKATSCRVARKYSVDDVLGQSREAPRRGGRRRPNLIAIGASTGGTEATRDVLQSLPAGLPPIVVTQHIPAAFSGPYARRLDAMCAMTVIEARGGEVLEKGQVYIAPGSAHLGVTSRGGRLVTELIEGPKVNRHMPSVDVLYRSVLRAVGPACVAVLLTGMGDDGARGLLELHEAGAHTIAQDEATSVVWGMPGEAVRLGAAQEILPLEEIARGLIRAVNVAPARA